MASASASLAESRAKALQIAHEGRRRDTVWTDGSRLGSGEVGAACVWQDPGGFTGWRFHLGSSKEALTRTITPFTRPFASSTDDRRAAMDTPSSWTPGSGQRCGVG